MCFKQQDAAKSLRGFEKFTAPALKAAFDAKKIYSTEQHDNALETVLDTMSAVDGLFIGGDGWTYAFASRLQFAVNYKTFTIRRTRPSGMKTEFEKLSASPPLAMKPAFHVQAYITEDETRAVVAIVETWRLIKYVGEHQEQWRATDDGESFYFAPWRELDGVRVFVVEDGHVTEKKNAA